MVHDFPKNFLYVFENIWFIKLQPATPTQGALPLACPGFPRSIVSEHHAIKKGDEISLIPRRVPLSSPGASVAPGEEGSAGFTSDWDYSPKL